MVLIYSEEKTVRLEYTFDLIFEKILRLPISFTTDRSVFSDSAYPKINYSNHRLNNELYIMPAPLLFVSGTGVPEPKPVVYHEDIYFFETSDDSFLPFDPFAAAFFLVTRLEEYLSTEKDMYGRYRHQNSILYRNKLIGKPVVNLWARLIAGKLKEKFPELTIPEPEFSFISTIDIDSAWAYLNKGILRNMGGIVRDLLNANFSNVFERLLVLMKNKKDPFDTYIFLNETFKSNEEKVLFFFLLGNYSRFDKNINHRNRALQKLIRQISLQYRTGIHPSFYGIRHNGEKWLPIEKERLESLTGSTVSCSRQHFLYLNLPYTYQLLIKNGISSDFTMGYAGICGFRAGICTPYLFYDIINEKITELTVFPVEVMDVSLRDYQGLSPEEASETIEKLMFEIKKVGGTFISLWHNESLTDKGRWRGYREVFRKMNQTGFTWANE